MITPAPGSAHPARTPFAVVAAIVCATACSGEPSEAPAHEVAQTAAPSTPTAAATDHPGYLAPHPGPDEGAQAEPAIPALATRTALFEAALHSDTPVLPLDEALADLQALAQDVALADQRVIALTTDSASGDALRSEVMAIRRAGPGDLPESAEVCAQAPCYRVEIYNHAHNSTVIALVDVAGARVISVDRYPGAQPDLPPHLVALAQAIAAAAPEVIEALGAPPAPSDSVMAGSKTALNETRCERSHHLCVAPTFLRGDRALWAIVDLTEGVLVGARWTSLGKSGGGPVVTERRLQDEVVSALYCDKETDLEVGDWALRYSITSSDGLRVSDVTFAGRPVLHDAKLVDWHVSYSGTDAFGYSDAIGCPTFSQAAVVARNGPAVSEIAAGGEAVGDTDGDSGGDVDGDVDDDAEGDAGGDSGGDAVGKTDGFSLTQDFMGEGWPAPCHYFYRQRFDFYSDGSFRVVAGNLGRGCGTSGTYRPVLRVALAGAENTFSNWDGTLWRDWETEGFVWQSEVGIDSPEGFGFRTADAAGDGYFIDPGRGQFGDGGRGDDALLYVTLRKPDVDEGHADLVTIGSCCNTDHRQGPERFIEPRPEPVAASPLVLWYVARMENDDTAGAEYCWADSVLEGGVYVPKAYPCYAGPLFIPIGR